MLKRRIIIILIILVSANLTFSQNKIISKNIVWQNKNYAGKNILSFDDCNYNDDFIPYYSGYLYVDSYDNELNLVKYELDGSINFKHINKYISDKIVINQKIYKAKDRYILYYKFYPYVERSGKFYRVKSFELKLTKKNKKFKDKFPSYASQSVLSSGKWVKIAIPKSGVYKISFDKLKELGFSTPENVRVFGNDAGMLPEYNNQYAPDDLIENKIYYGSNYILFYAEGASLWKYDENNDFFDLKKNCYTDTAYYFLTDKNTGFNNHINSLQASGTPSATITKSIRLEHHEQQDVNILHSGRPFLGESFDYTTTQSISFSVNSPDASTASKAKIAMAARSPYSSSASVSIGGVSSSINFLTAYGDKHQKYADYQTVLFGFSNSSSNPTMQITYNKPTSSAKAWLDYITLNLSENMNFYEQMHIRSTENVGSGKVCKFVISNANSSVMVWDVTSPTHPYLMPTTLSGSSLYFTANTDSIKHFIAFTVDSCPEPVFKGTETGEVDNQNLHGISASTDMMVITAPEFLQVAQNFADFHKSYDNFNVSVATTIQIYNEFSSGMKDVSAIRNFIRMVYIKSGGRLSYVLLLGDGTYDNHSPITEFNPDYIPTYQTWDYFNSPGKPTTTVFDNYFALLDDNEGALYGAMDVAVGRIPVKTLEEAQGVFDKVKEYVSPSSFGDWQNIVTLFTDDRDDDWETFTSDAEQVADIIDTLYPFINIKKIYSDSYQQVTSANGEEYPNVVLDLNNRINNGTLILNYLGHGGYNALTSERIVTIHQIENWHNKGKYMLMITGTCEFSRFDDAYPSSDATSAGELSLLNENGGAIALLTTARVSFAGSNTSINKQLYNYLFASENGKRLTIGDAYITALNEMTSSYKTYFFLLGDPAIRLAYATDKAELTKINGVDIDSFADTLHALDKVTVEGVVTDNAGNILNDFNGEVVLTYFDKKRDLQTLNNDGYGSMQYWDKFNMLFKGRASVTNGEFSLKFIIPKDIFYNYGKSKFSLFAFDAEKSATGYNNQILGGINPNAQQDVKGPDIKLFMNDTNFVSGSITDQNPIVLALLSDESGINISSAGIGHDITIVLDNDPSKTYSLNEYFTGDLNNSASGKVSYGLYNLDEGKHTVKLKAWDVFNNSSEKTIDFVVAKSSDLTIEHLLNYPNPFTTHTTFYFEHNRPGVPLDVILQIMTVSGKIVKTFHVIMTTDGFRSDPIEWNGLDDFGKPIGRGVYIYRIKIITPE